MRPTPEAQTKIQNRVSASTAYDWSMGDEALASAINEDLVDNPAQPETVDVPYEMAEIMDILDASSLQTVRSEGGVTAIADAVRDQNDTRVLNWSKAYLKTGDISQTEYNQIESLVTDEQQDSDYDAQIPWPEKALGRLVDSNDIANSRP